jgi:hypothetical protein
MLTISRKQMSEFERVVRNAFEDNMVRHVREEFPDRTVGMPEASVREQVRWGMRQAEGYGFTNRGPVIFFIELMFLLGPEFDSDPRYPWASDILTGKTDQMDRSDHLHEVLMNHLHGQQSPGAGEDVTEQEFEDNMVEHLKKVFPIRTADMGEDVVREVIRIGIGRADGYELDTPGPVCLFIEMSFLLGSGFDTDPQYPWTQQVLADTTDQVDRANRLCGEALKYRAVVVGPMEEYQRQAFGRLDAWHLEEAFASDEEDEVAEEETAWEPRILDYFQRLYPEKCQYAGSAAMRQLAQRAVAQAEDEQFLVRGSAVLLGVLMLMLGHDCFTDPQFSWIDDTFNGAEEATDAEKARVLTSRLKAHVRSVMREFPPPRWDYRQ